MSEKTEKEFPFAIGEVILAKHVKEIFYAKIVSINQATQRVVVLFDDNSEGEVEFNNVFSVNETTADFICVVCRQDITEPNNDIVLCDICSVGFHQNCHKIPISSDILLPEVPWQCFYCERNEKNPFVQVNPFENKTMASNNKQDNDENSETAKDQVKQADSTIQETSKLNIGSEKDDETKEPQITADKTLNETDDTTRDETESSDNVTEVEINKELENVNKQNSEEGLRNAAKDNLNHVESSPFERFNEKKQQSDYIQKCSHHDMSNETTNYTTLTKEKDIIHCKHSDIFKKLLNKDRKVNRVSPYIHYEGNTMRLDERQHLKQYASSSTKTHPNRYIDDSTRISSTKTHPNRYIDDSTRISSTKTHPDRYLDDSTRIISSKTHPNRYIDDSTRHALLVERLKREKEIIENEIQESRQHFDRKPPNVNKVEMKNITTENSSSSSSSSSVNTTGEIQILKVESLNKTKYQELNYPSSSSSTNQEQLINHVTSSPNGRSEILSTVQSFTPKKDNTQDVTNTSMITTPKIIADQPSKQYSIPSEKDLQSIHYDALSSFKKTSFTDKHIKERSNSSRSPVGASRSKGVQGTPLGRLEPTGSPSSKPPIFSLPSAMSTEAIQSSVRAMFQGNMKPLLPSVPAVNLPPEVAGIVQNNIAAFKKNLALALKNDPNFIQNNPAIIPTMQKMYQLSPSQMSDIPGFGPPISPFPNSLSNEKKNEEQFFFEPISASDDRSIARKNFSLVEQISSAEEVNRRSSEKEPINEKQQIIESSTLPNKSSTLPNKEKLIEVHNTSDVDIDKRIKLLSREIQELQRQKEIQNSITKDDSLTTEEKIRRLDRDLTSKVNPRGTIRYSDSPDNNRHKNQDYEPRPKSPVKPRFVNYYEESLLMNQLQNKHDETDNQSRANYELNRFRELAELKQLCSEREPTFSQTSLPAPPSHSGDYSSTGGETSYRPYTNTRPYQRSYKRTYEDPDSNRSNLHSPPYKRSMSTSVSPRASTMTSRYAKPSSHSSTSGGTGKPKKPCAKCGMNAYFLCSECRSVWYCSQNCQLSDWRFHAKSCTKKPKNVS